MAETSTLITNPRLYYLDWMRVLAFAVLIITNCAEVFAGEKWWISNSETHPIIADILVFFRQWRMALLFIISGVAISLMLQKKTILQFLDDRFVRILIPLISGMFLIIPPMIFYIWRYEGSAISIQEFYLSLLNFDWFPRGNFHWIHLWYLAFVFIFSIAILPIITYFKNEKGKALIKRISINISRPTVLFPLVLLFHLPYFAAKNYLSSNNIPSLLYYFPYFVFGSLFFTQSLIRQTIVNNRQTALFAGLITSGLLYAFVWIKGGPSLLTTDSVLSEIASQPIKLVLLSLNQWFWVIAITGFSIRFLNFGNTFLSYANNAVYPFYILHQPLIIIIAYYLIPVDASMLFKFSAILSGTLISILIIYEIFLKHFTLLKLMFGLRTDIQLTKLFPRTINFISQIIPQLRSARNP